MKDEVLRVCVCLCVCTHMLGQGGGGQGSLNGRGGPWGRFELGWFHNQRIHVCRRNKVKFD